MILGIYKNLKKLLILCKTLKFDLSFIKVITESSSGVLNQNLLLLFGKYKKFTPVNGKIV